MARRSRLVAAIEGGLLLACLLYCLLAPKQYEAVGRVELRTSPASQLNLDSSVGTVSASILSAPTALETMADVLHSDKLAWRVIRELKLYEAPGFKGAFDRKFPSFRVAGDREADPEAQAWLLDRFSRHLRVQSLPRTMLVEIRFRSHDAALSAMVVNTLIRDYSVQESEAEVTATAQDSALLGSQLKELKATVDEDQAKLAEFEKQHGILSAPMTVTENTATEAEHNGAMLAVDELDRQLVMATADRILREAEYRAAAKGDPEQVLASDAQLGAGSGFATAGLQQIRARRSDLEQERAQLSAEHGENFPRVVEIGRQLADLDRQKKAEDAKLVERFQSAWQAAQDRERLVRKSVEEATGAGLKQNRAEARYAAMKQEAERSHDLYMRLEEKMQEAGLAAGMGDANIEVVDPARRPVKPAAPDLPLYMAITFFAGLWLALGGALLMEAWENAKMHTAAAMLLVVAALTAAHGQAPTPSTSGLPTGVAKIPQSSETRSQPDARTAPAVWNGQEQAGKNAPGTAGAGQALEAPAPIGPGDLLEIGEYHALEFRSQVKVSAAGTVMLPMIGEVKVSGLDDQAAARAIEAELVKQKMLLHPMVSVLVMASAGQDVSVLGEVARPGMYPYAVHHRLLDAISEASGLAPAAGRIVTIYHRSDPDTPHTVALAPGGKEAGVEHNPELSPGDTVEVSRAGLVYVVGDVIRPGGFTLDPAQKLTVVQALALAWGPTQNAATSKGLLIREQNGGRTVMALNVKRLLRGLDPDVPVEDGDIVFIPDSAAKNLWNRSMESAIQSAVGVTIYSGLVYSQRY